MRKRSVRQYLTWFLSICLFLVIAGGEALILVYTPISGAQDHQQHPNQPGQKEEPCGQIQSGASYFETARYYGCAAIFKNLTFIDTYHDTINAFAALAVALFTFTLWRSTIDLYRAGENTAELARRSADALEASERGHVVELIEWGDFSELYKLATWYKKSPDMKSDPITVPVRVRFKNYGRTPATVISYGYEAKICKEPPDLDKAPSDKFLEEPTIGEKGESKAFENSEIVQHDWQQSMLLCQGDLKVWLIGNIFYFDVFDTVTTRNFIWRYDHPMKRLVPYSSVTGRNRKDHS